MLPLRFAVVVDVDPDWRIPGLVRGAYHGAMRWNGLSVGVPQLLKTIQSLRDARGQNLRFTWMLRSDEQMGQVLGDPAYLAETFASFWQQRIAAGDEIGWHPHTWRLSKGEGIWYQETEDVDWIRSCLRDGYAALARHCSIKVAKSGWTWHSAFSMQLFNELGLKADVSAVPGMKYRAFVPGTQRPLGQYDWSRAPQEPYHPSKHDPQLPGSGRALSILEIPNWTFPVGRFREVLHSARGRSWRDFANPAKEPRLVRNGFGRPPHTVPFVCYFHPEELMCPTRLFALEHVARNLRTLLESCSSSGISTESCTVSQLVAG